MCIRDRANTGQFERTLIVADDDSYVSYLEGCTAPMRDENQFCLLYTSNLCQVWPPCHSELASDTGIEDFRTGER